MEEKYPMTFQLKEKYSREKLKAKLSFGHYSNQKLAVCIETWTDDCGGYWEPYTALSVNTDDEIEEGEFVGKTYSENDGIVEQLLALGLVEDTGKRVSFGYVVDQPILRIVKK